MQKTSKALLIAIFLFTFVGAAFAAGFTVDDLSTSKIGKFPSRWRTWPLQRSAAERVYAVAEENGKRFVQAKDESNESQQIFLNFHWDIKQYPDLKWKWRATKLPEGAKESDDSLNDSACAIYVVVGKYTGNALKYAWSTTLPVGQIVTRRDGKLKIKIVDSGSAKVGKWVDQERNVLSDYKEAFGEDLGKDPSGIAILTDGNAVQKPSGCDYMDIAVGPAS